MIKCNSTVKLINERIMMTQLLHFKNNRYVNRDKTFLFDGGSERIHVKHPLYRLRYTLLTRCYNPKPSDYKYYKGKGIQVCDEWKHDPESFFSWCLKNGWRRGLSLDRIDPSKDYCPENCQFLTIENNLSKMHSQGKKKGENSGNAKLTLKQVNEIREKLKIGVVGTRIAKEYGVSKSTIYAINAGQNWK